jgi:hypothetical protein
MSSPRHLWSGDWELDSAAAREELAKRRAQVDEPAEIPSVAPAPRARPSVAATRPSAAAMAARAVAWLRRLAASLVRLTGRGRRAVAGSPGVNRRLRIAMLIALVALASAAAAYAVTTMLVGSGGISASANNARAWLGIDVTGSPQGILVTDVVPTGPAGKAGLQPGDLLVSINNQPVGTVDAVNQSLAGLHSGDKVPIQFTRGLATYMTLATLASRPPGYP